MLGRCGVKWQCWRRVRRNQKAGEAWVGEADVELWVGGRVHDSLGMGEVLGRCLEGSILGIV